jgi:hypothetical protein
MRNCAIGNREIRVAFLTPLVRPAVSPGPERFNASIQTLSGRFRSIGK